jgi:hypothetical protein
VIYVSRGDRTGFASTLSAFAARYQPTGIEPAVGLAVLGQPADVPVTDKRRIGGIDGRAATDEDDPAWKARVVCAFLAVMRRIKRHRLERLSPIANAYAVGEVAIGEIHAQN